MTTYGKIPEKYKMYEHDAFVRSDGSIYVPVYGRGYLDEEHLERNREKCHYFKFHYADAEDECIAPDRSDVDAVYRKQWDNMFNLGAPRGHKTPKKPKKEEKKMITKKSLKKDIDELSKKVDEKSIFDNAISQGSDVQMSKWQCLGGDEVVFSVPALHDKANKKAVEGLIDKVKDLTGVIEKQLVLIKKLCPHKDVEVSKEEITGALSIAYRHCKMKPFAYTKKCKLCGHSEMISETEYYSIQKAIIDSKVKELNE